MLAVSRTHLAHTSHTGGTHAIFERSNGLIKNLPSRSKRSKRQSLRGHTWRTMPRPAMPRAVYVLVWLHATVGVHANTTTTTMLATTDPAPATTTAHRHDPDDPACKATTAAPALPAAVGVPPCPVRLDPGDMVVVNALDDDGLPAPYYTWLKCTVRTDQ